MSFKVGDRVRIVGGPDETDFIRRNAGKTATILAPSPLYDWKLSLDEHYATFSVLESEIERIAPEGVDLSDVPSGALLAELATRLEGAA